jgi:hypothetical protein
MKLLVRKTLYALFRTFYNSRWNAYERIIITGSQRSGTTAVSQMIADDLGYRNIDEAEFGIHDYNRFEKLLELKNVVIQCPALTHRLLDIHQESTLIIWMHRPFEEIRKSMKRIGWDKTEEAFEKQKYFDLESVDYSKPIEQIKNEYWTNVQKPNLHCNYMVLNYHSSYIKFHPRFLSDKYRKNLSSKQTRLG